MSNCWILLLTAVWLWWLVREDTYIYYNFVQGRTVILAINVSYCTQTPWMFQSAIPHTKNITFGLYLIENTRHHQTETNCLMCLVKNRSLVVLQKVSWVWKCRLCFDIIKDLQILAIYLSSHQTFTQEAVKQVRLPHNVQLIVICCDAVCNSVICRDMERELLYYIQ